ncbi:DUF3460 family protein [Quisquiliibacterium transsilvanicum]|uniref:DUF3460 family protein n=1 Tax=Quisquiliibacterium transsilvanicum TaxID=1549638 RepID=A0A7W8HJA1_9BURK|nr:DUF3460 family protein [Quisquiliibacterium transsilvanicum]MBB5272451.1 hypothetical protein [Quisquiliibacterium transsilvanicum]
MYESDITRFLRELKGERPQLEAEQRKGRAIWWDRPQDLEAQQRDKASRVPQQPYVYQTRS